MGSLYSASLHRDLVAGALACCALTCHVFQHGKAQAAVVEKYSPGVAHLAADSQESGGLVGNANGAGDARLARTRSVDLVDGLDAAGLSWQISLGTLVGHAQTRVAFSQLVTW